MPLACYISMLYLASAKTLIKCHKVDLSNIYGLCLLSMS